MLDQMNMNNHRMIAGMENMPKLSDQEQQAAVEAYLKMFRALTYQNLLNGKTLGAAWHDATRQMESFINSKDKFNPAAKQIADILATHKKDIAKMTMTHKNKDKVIKVTPQQREKLQSRISAELRDGQSGLNKIITKYQPYADKARTQTAKLEAEKSKQASVAAATKQKSGVNAKQGAAANAKNGAAVNDTKKTTKFADATKQLDAMAMEQMKLKLFMQLQQNERQYAA